MTDDDDFIGVIMTDDDDFTLWEKPCESCGSKRVKSTEVNDDNPEADEHEMNFCADCWEVR